MLQAELGGCEPSALLFLQRGLDTTIYPHRFSWLRDWQCTRSKLYLAISAHSGRIGSKLAAGCTAELLFSSSARMCNTLVVPKPHMPQNFFRQFQQMTTKRHAWTHSSRGTPSVRHQRLPVKQIALSDAQPGWRQDHREILGTACVLIGCWSEDAGRGTAETTAD